MTGLEVDPRSVMGNVVKQADNKGLTCMSGAEFEVGVQCPTLTSVLSVQGNSSECSRQRLCQSHAFDSRQYVSVELV